MAKPISCPMSDRLLHLVDHDQTDEMPPELVEHLTQCQPCQEIIERAAVGASSWLTGALACGITCADRPPELRSAIEQLKGLTTVHGGRTQTYTAQSLEFLSKSEHQGAIGAVGPYPVLEVIGQGGMGIVLKTIDPALNRIVAVKVLSPQLAANGTARQRFMREARAAAAVAHEHVVGIHAVAESNGLPYLVMEYVPGLSLQEKIDCNGPLESLETVRIALQIAEGLAAAHAQGLVHRDIKPANILLENGVGRVRITDFGLARAVDDAACTQHGQVAGTPEYMAPEQAASKSIDHRADLFSLGCVIYACCTGHSPFRSSSSLGALHQVATLDPQPMRSSNIDVPSELEVIVNRLLSKSPEARFATAREVADVFRKLLIDMHDPNYQWHCKSKFPFDAVVKPAKGRSAVLIGLISVVVLVLVTALINQWFFSPPTQNQQVGQQTNSPPNTSPMINATPPPPDMLPSAPPPIKAMSLDGHTRPVRGIVVDPENKFAISCSGWPESDGTIRIWSLENAQQLHTIQVVEPGTLTMDALALAAKSGKVLVGLSDGTVRGFSIASQQEVLSFKAHSSAINCLAVSPDGSMFASAGDDGSVGVWKCENGERVQMFDDAHQGACRSVVFAPKGTILASGGLDGMVRLWDVQEGKQSHQFPVKHGRQQAWSIAFANKGQTIIICGDGAAGYDVPTGEFLWPLQGNLWGTITSDVAVSPDETKIATCSYEGTFCVWDLKERRAICRGNAGVGVVWKVAFTSDSEKLLTGGGGVFENGKCVPGNDFSIRVWSLKPPTN